ncbi:MAG: DNA/RNA non-specific endonuclease, partial [Saprospiraceae bacterium]|nr:DNA/RNA non-specific endonuclease [Saprospiraceae bacterium]
EYSEPHEQARWVAHIILPDIARGTVFRSNDFRPDTLVPTGSAVEADYFLKTMNANGTWEYDGFGYDRGHLAPSADFRWSATALSESYFYSNMSPQLAEFNRGGWSELEALLRGYVTGHPGVQLYVVTGPVLEAGLPVIERGVNRVAIPKQFFKVALDWTNRRAIGFVMPNARISYPLESFAVSVDAVEQLTGLDFFNALPDSVENAVEAQVEPAAWLPQVAQGDVEPLAQPGLPPNHFNTVVGGRYAGQNTEVTVCGTVVGSRYSRTGNLWLNLDKQFPNQIFSVFIRKEDLANFSEDPKVALENRQVCFTGKVETFNGTPTINIEREESLYLYPR